MNVEAKIAFWSLGGGLVLAIICIAIATFFHDE